MAPIVQVRTCMLDLRIEASNSWHSVAGWVLARAWLKGVGAIQVQQPG